MLSDATWNALLGLQGAHERRSRFADRPALWVGATEVAHVDADGTVDVRLTRAVIGERRAALRADPRVHLRPSSSADWIGVDGTDEALVIELITAAVAATTTRG